MELMMMMMFIITSMERDYVSELRPPTGLLFVHPPGDISAWKTAVGRYRQRKLQIRPPELSGNPTSKAI
jgi:hypothetical protein